MDSKSSALLKLEFTHRGCAAYPGDCRDASSPKLGEFDAEEMKAMSVQIFRSIEKPVASANGRMTYVHDSNAAERSFNEQPSSPVGLKSIALSAPWLLRAN